MADAPPKKRKRGRPKKPVEVKPADLPLDDLAASAAAAAEDKPDPDGTGLADDPPKGDAPPSGRGEGRARGSRKRVTKKGTEQIEDALAEILQIPAVPAAMFGDDWMAAHFTTQGRQLANRIAVVSERNPVLRGWCERMLEGESLAVLLMAGVLYAAPPLMHFGVIPGGQMMGIPVMRKTAAGPGPVPAAEQPHTAAREPVPAQQYGGEPAEVYDQPPEPEQAPDKVTPNAHFVGGENGDGPPLWTEQMIEG